MIFRKTNADAIIFVNNETKSAGLIIRVNSKLNLLEGFKQYIKDNIFTAEPGWQTIGTPVNLFINHGIQSKTPTKQTTQSIKSLVINYMQ